MKRLIIVWVLLACIAVVAFASLRTSKQRAGIKTEKKEIKKKHECSRTCAYS